MGKKMGGKLIRKKGKFHSSKWVMFGLVMGVVIATVGSVAALNGWFGGGSSIPSDTMTRGLVGYWNMDGNTKDSGPYAKNGTFNGAIATGGTITISGSYIVHTFTSSGTFTVTGSGNVEYLVIAGGGGGGNNCGAGGGAGGYRSSVVGESSGGGAAAESTLAVSAGSYTVTIGDGGCAACVAAADGRFSGGPGGNSVFGSITATGGGGGHAGGWGHGNGYAGGSGGGSSSYTTAYTGGAGTANQGYKGSNTDGDSSCSVGAGGGAGGAAQDLSAAGYATEGVGLSSSITGSSVVRATGGKSTTCGANGAANSGDGGCGYSAAGSGVGGSGVVIVRYSSSLAKLTLTADKKGQADKAVSFDGTYNYVSVGNVYNGVKSVEFWVNADNTTKKILGLNDTQYVEVSDRTITATGWTSPTIYVDGVKNSSAISTSTWSHVVITSETGINATSTDLGRYSTNYFDGTLDEIKFYNRALSDSEVRFHYNRGGPVAHWKMDEGEGRTAYDSTDNNNDGTLVLAGSATSSAWVAGKYGTALSFDGTDDYMQATVSQGTTAVSLWVQNSGVWQHVVNNNGTYYVNGIAGATPTSYPVYISGTTVQIGKSAVSTFVNCLVDEVRIYNYARTPEEIRLDYNAGFSAYFGPKSDCNSDPGACMTQGLVGYWNMDGNTKDSGPYAKNGTFNGAIATGGTITISGSYIVHTFTSSGTFTVTGSGNVEYLVIAGGGGGGTAYNSCATGGGGAGGLVYSASYAVTAQAYSVTVGSGGGVDSNGTNSVFGAITATGGGAGGDTVAAADPGSNGGCGGGGAGGSTSGAGGTGSQGYNGGNGYGSSGSATRGGGGGGGAGAIGSNGTSGYGGAGGDGLQYSITGTATYYAGGGGGRNGSNCGIAASGQGNNIGGGGTGGGSGVAGIVIVRYSSSLAKLTLTADKKGQADKAVSFDGTYNYVSVGNVYNGVKSVEFWVKADNTTKKIMDLSNTAYVEVSNAAIAATGWTSPTIYVNGVKNSTTIATSTWAHVVITTETGINATSTDFGRVISDYFDGTLDEIKFYNRALSDSEVRFHYNRGGPVAHWKFDEGEGRTAYDSTDNNNDGTLVLAGSATSSAWVAGKYGSALSFDGVDDYVNVSNSITANTVSLWLKPAVSTDEILQLSASANIQISNNAITTTGFTSPTVYVNGQNTTSLTTNTWNHITVTTGTSITANAVKLGLVGSGYFQGLLDEVRIYNYARTAEEIRLDYNAGFAAHFGPSGRECKDDPASCMTEGLVGYWGFEEGSGTTAHDASNYANNGVASSTWATGKVGSALSFDGTDDYVEVPHHSSLSITGTISIEAWINLDSVAIDYQTVVAKRLGSGAGTVNYALQVSYDEVRLYLYDGTWRIYSTSAANLVAGTWYHIMLTYDETTARIYINGSEESGSWTSGAAAAMPTITDPVRMGKIVNSAGESDDFLDGLIDELRIYNRLLSVAEIRYHYNRGGPVAQWKMDEGEGRTVYDSTDNNNDGTLVLAGSATSSAWVAGKYGSALNFDGVDDYVDMGDINTVEGIGALTVSVWIYPTTDNVREMIVSKDLLGQRSWYLSKSESETDNKTTFTIGDATAGVIDSTSAVTTNSWSHIVAIYNKNGATPADRLKIYINGVLASGMVGTDRTTDLPSTTAKLQIGAREYVGTRKYFSGKIDEVRIYNYARTQEQIQQDYNAGLSAHFK